MSENDDGGDLDNFIDNEVVYGGDIRPVELVESCTFVNGRRLSTRRTKQVERYVDSNYAKLMFDDVCEEDVFRSDEDDEDGGSQMCEEDEREDEEEETFFYQEERDDDDFLPESDTEQDEDGTSSDMIMTNELQESDGECEGTSGTTCADTSTGDSGTKTTAESNG
jgi:hypothetical protein